MFSYIFENFPKIIKQILFKTSQSFQMILILYYSLGDHNFDLMVRPVTLNRFPSFTILPQPTLTLNRPAGGIRPRTGSSLYCAETVSSRKLKLSDFYYILIGLNSEYKPVPWEIHCCHGNAIVDGCSVKFWLKLHFSAQIIF